MLIFYRESYSEAYSFWCTKSRNFSHVLKKYASKISISKKLNFWNFYNHPREGSWAGKRPLMQYTGVRSPNTSKNHGVFMPNQRFALPKPGCRCQNLRWAADILTAAHLLDQSRFWGRPAERAHVATLWDKMNRCFAAKPVYFEDR